MALQQQFQPVLGLPELTEAQYDLRGRTLHLLTARWLRTETAAVYAGYGSTAGFTEWAAEAGIPSIQRARGRVRVLLWDRLDIDARLESLKVCDSHASTVGRRRAPRHGSDFISPVDTRKDF